MGRGEEKGSKASEPKRSRKQIWIWLAGAIICVAGVVAFVSPSITSSVRHRRTFGQKP